MSLLPVAEAQQRLLAHVPLTGEENVRLAGALGRVLAEDLIAGRDQPPFAASAMDGYAVKAEDASKAGARLRLIGQSRAGERFKDAVESETAVRIFTGAPVPDGADAILIQENAERDGDCVIVREPVERGQYIRPIGLDFRNGETLVEQGHVLNPRTLGLSAALNKASVAVRTKPTVAILSTGDELVIPGSGLSDDQIPSSNNTSIGALCESSGAHVIDLGIAQDDIHAIQTRVSEAREADILVLIGGASVGEHDLVHDALTGIGMNLDFWKIAMRPGKPLMVGRLGESRVLGLPGNPVSALVCGTIFLGPLIRTFLGLPAKQPEARARLANDLPENDQRQDYLRARLREPGDLPVVETFKRQDSSMLATLARSDFLIVRPPFAPAISAGEIVPILRLGK